MQLEEKKYYTVNQEKVARYAKALSHPVRVFITINEALNWAWPKLPLTAVFGVTE